MNNLLYTMSTVPKSRTQQILSIMLVLSWIVTIGLLIEAGAILFSYTVSLFNPEASKNLYKGLDLYELRQANVWQFHALVSFIIVIACMKVWVAYLVTRTLSKIKMVNPFKMEVVRDLEAISYNLLGIWIIAMVYNGYMDWLSKHNTAPLGDLMPRDFIFMVGLVYLVSQIFKRGVEIQNENELTV